MTTSLKTGPLPDEAVPRHRVILPRRRLASGQPLDAHPGLGPARNIGRRRRADDVLARRTALCVPRGPPASLRSDTGPACTASAVRSGLQRRGGTTRCIAPGSPWENGSGESCTGTLRDAGLNPAIFTTLPEAQIRIARWRREDNPVRPHSALGSRPPAPDALEIRPPHPAPWADRRGAALPSALAQQSGAGHAALRLRPAFGARGRHCGACAPERSAGGGSRPKEPA